MLSVTVVMYIPDLPLHYQPNLGLALDTFLFPVTTPHNLPCHTTPRHTAVSIHQMDWADTLGRIAPYPNPFSSHPMEFSDPQITALNAQASNSPLAMNPTLTDLHTDNRRDSLPILQSPPTHSSSNCDAPSISLFLRRKQLTSPSHNLVVPLHIVSARQFEPGLQRWALTVSTTMLPCTLALKTPESIPWYQPNEGLTLDTFLFPDTTSNIFLCPNMP